MQFPLALLSLVAASSAYQLVNVTVGPNDPNIQYYPICSSHEFPLCTGAWWLAQDPRFTNGTAMMAEDPGNKWSGVEPYFAYNFKGSAMYMFQWVNASVASQVQYIDDAKYPYNNISQTLQGQLGSELQLVMTWSQTGLNPRKTHTMGIQHTTDIWRGNTYIVFDHMIITMAIEDPSDQKPKSNTKQIVGGVVGAVLGLLALFLAFVVWRRHRRNKYAGNKKSTGKYEWQGTAGAPATLKFVDPSTEIEASERIAREGRLEEELEMARKDPTP
ncbi:hypothetical protein FRB99_001140 [Tulasnella sp. 403]|nr:hypothetical protein FRB99_001140 [Tulasnella sp. 403]